MVGRNCSISRLGAGVEGGHLSQSLKRNEQPAEEFGKLVVVAKQRTRDDRICILEA